MATFSLGRLAAFQNGLNPGELEEIGVGIEPLQLSGDVGGQLVGSSG